ncbi:GumC domain-containing protein [Ferruginibacter albus]|uniref:hypothetical protein n=1 Tax=Ferruginibacter albus TaxID=2875540 RepID=UPI001CC73AEE|nr:hypothetical protein [Ferruginibacter albus]UAY52578.1 hypothetical protein K9M53_02530 [Ferruginibacter albus]
MNSNDFLKAAVEKVSRFKALIITISIVAAALFFIVAKFKTIQYTSKATLFPLNNSSENGGPNSLSGLLGLGTTTQNFNVDASVNIIELTKSRNVRESAALIKLSGKWNNKTVAELLIEEANKHAFPLIGEKIKMPTDSASLAMTGGQLLEPSLDARLNKNGVLELNFTSTNEELVKPVSEAIISTISQFYINLKIEKATLDYKFTLVKIDSLQHALDSLDGRIIGMHNSTLFTPVDKIQYSLPKDNIEEEKLRTTREQDIAINNREEAVWRLQKITPIVAVLDKPNPPYQVKKASSLVYAIGAFIVAALLTIILLLWELLKQLIKAEISKAMSKSTKA